MTVQLGKVAWDHPPTAAAYKRLALRRTVWLGAMLAPAVIAGVCTWSGLLLQARGVLTSAAILTIPFLPLVVFAQMFRRRVATVLQAYPWRELQGRHVPQSPSLIAVRFTDECTATFRMFPFPIQLTTAQDDDGPRLWFAGDPRYGGVASTMGGQNLVRLLPDNTPRGAWTEADGDDGLARRAGLVRSNGKGTWT
ncbi:hypothetical protein ACGFYU_28475 [Streptomyces sp. NPDC048337]|uniref:hypothetical protein n=1 Tax=Streptomyces sp. NPDC048337 TaxID=3365535 RepID=UPI00371B191E